MKRILFVGFLILICFSTFSQDWDFKKPDYKQIEKSISNPNSEFYYPVLFARFQKADTTLSLEERRHLYYGYTFQMNYSPYGHSDFQDSINTILQKDSLNDVDIHSINRFGDSILQENPFDLRVLEYQTYALEYQGETEKLENKNVQIVMVLDAIFSSGDGTSKKDAFYVIYTSHEYFILNLIGLQFSAQSLTDHYDYMEVADNDYGIEGLYFDVSPCLNTLKNMFE